MEAFCYRAKVLKVVDGDTLEVDIDLGFGVWMRDQSVRLNGVDTPESRTSNPEEKVRGLLSKSKVKELCPVGSSILIKTVLSEEREKFGRVLGVVMNEAGVNVNNFLIENNYAVAYEGQSKESVQDLHKKNAQLLKERGEL